MPKLKVGKLLFAIGTKYLCRNCGVTFSEYDIQKPRHYSYEEWEKYWEQNIKAK